MKVSIFLYAILMLLMCLVTGVQAALTLPITDNFPSTGTEQSWEDYDSAYTLVEAFTPSAPSGDGYVFNVNDGSGWQDVFLSDDDGTLGNYKITAYLYLPSSDGTNWGRVGIFGRAQGTHYTTFRNCYFFCADSDASDCLRVGRYYTDGSDWDVYYQGDVTLDAWHKFELELSSANIVARLDDVEVYSGTDATDFTAGYVGIFNYMATTSAPPTRCDRITIESSNLGVDAWDLY